MKATGVKKAEVTEGLKSDNEMLGNVYCSPNIYGAIH
jgi:hypothetical protein